jgi:tetratricopeptide (TPR) repeat protein
MPDVLDRLKAALADRFAIQREIGRGGMAVVYLAEDVAHHRPVAVKILRPELAAALGPERFLREIAIAAQLNHPHILPLLNSGNADGVLYYVMPFVEGETLRQRLTREGQFPLEEAIRIAREMAAALGYAHSRDIVHRDIKPENVLFSAGVAVVADFGIARAISEAGGEPLTATGMSIGTPGYMSPEQASGAERLDGRSDIFSLGCVLYEMLTGERPFEGSTPSAIIAKVVQQPVPDMRIVRPSVPPSVTRCVEKALDKVPADRYQTAGEFADALAQGLQPGGRRRSDRGRRRRGPAIALGSAAALLAGWLLWAPVRGLLVHSRASEGDALDPTHVAVLNIDAPGTGSDVDALAANLRARVSDALGSIEALTIVSRSALTPYLDAGLPLDSVARVLRVGVLIDGHLESFGDTIRAALRLIDGRTGNQLGVTQAQVARGERNLLPVMADTVTRLLRRRLGDVVHERRLERETKSAAALDHLQRAERRMRDFDAMVDAGDFRAAGRVLRECDSLLAVAERLDPHWTEPLIERAQLAQHQINLALARHEPDDGTLLRQGIAHANRAVAMAPKDPATHQVRGLLRYWLWRDYPPEDSAAAASLRDEAESDLRSAIDGNPDRAAVMRTLSELLAEDGRLVEAVHYAEQAYQTDPYLENTIPFLLRLFQYNLQLDRDEAASRWCHLGADRFPDSPMFYHCQLQLMAWSPAAVVDPGRAAELERQTLDYYIASMRDQLEPHLSLLVAAVLARGGRADSARRIVAPYLRQPSDAEGIVLPAAGVLALLGDSVRALDLVQAFAAAHPDAREAIRRGPELRTLRALPRFAEIVGSGSSH